MILSEQCQERCRRKRVRGPRQHRVQLEASLRTQINQARLDLMTAWTTQNFDLNQLAELQARLRRLLANTGLSLC